MNKIIMGSLLAFLLTSCATIISGSKQEIKFHSNPANATVYVDGLEVGKTPFQTKLTRKEKHNVEIKLEGYKPYTVQLTKSFNGWYVGNILFGGIIGLVVDPITGAMYNLTPKEVNTNLESGVAFNKTKEGIYIAVSLKPNSTWKKVGQLEKE